MRRWLAVPGTLALAGLLLVACSSSPPAHKAATPLRAGATACGSDQSSNLSTFLNAQPNGSTVTLPKNRCYTVTGSVHIASKTNLTINGNGAHFNRSADLGTGVNVPMLELTQNTNLTIKNLTLNGDWSGPGTNGGSTYEGQYGVRMEGETNTTLNGVNINSVQGDCLLLQAANDITPADIALNTGIKVLNSTYNGCGYHGITVEAANGFLFQNNHVSNVDLDAITFDVEAGSTQFYSNGQPYAVAEDNISILNNVWTSFGNDWLGALQQAFPIQEQHITLSGNTLNSSTYAGIGSAYIDIWSAIPGTVSTQYLTVWLTVTNNKSLQAMGKPYDEPNPWYVSQSGNVAIGLYSVAGVNLSNNVFPVQGGNAAIVAWNNYGLTVKNNNFSGASAIFDTSYGYPHEGAVYVTQCGNHYGAGGASLDSAC